MAADDVLLHAFEIVGLAADGCLVEHLRRLLERSCRHEALRLQGGTRDALKDLGGGGRHGVTHLDKAKVTALKLRIFVTELAGCHNHTLFHRLAVAGIGHDLLSPDAIVLLGKIKLVDNLLFKEACVAWIVDLYLAHHLAYNNLEVLIVDLHALQTVNVLDFVDDVFLNGRGALNGQDVGRRDGTIG